MLDGRVLGASQVEYKPWETPSKERGAGLHKRAAPARELRGARVAGRVPEEATLQVHLALHGLPLATLTAHCSWLLSLVRAAPERASGR